MAEITLTFNFTVTFPADAGSYPSDVRTLESMAAREYLQAEDDPLGYLATVFFRKGVSPVCTTISVNHNE